MGQLRAAAAQVELQPPAGGWMTGFAARVQPSAGAHDPIMARAVLLHDSVTPLAIVTCDVIGFTADAVADMRLRISQRSGIPAAHILIACTHTHSGPATMPFRGAMGHVDHVWLAKTERRIVDLVCRLPEALQPATLTYGDARVPGIGYNRQDPRRPIDDTLTVVGIDGEDGRAIATLLNYATHAVVLGPRNLEYSGDYPGEAARQIAELRGGAGLFLLGACGDVDPIVYRDRGWGSGTFFDTRDIGGRLADAGMDILARARPAGEVTIAVAGHSLDLPLEPPPDESALDASIHDFERDQHAARAQGNAMEELVALAMLDWAGALKQAMQERRVPQTLPVEVFAARLNELRIAAVPLEPYSDISLRVRERLKPAPLLFAGYSNGLFGYCASRWAKEQGGYGPDNAARWFPGMLTPIGVGADEKIVDAITALS